MNAITTITPAALPTEADTEPTLTSRELHSRLVADVARGLVGRRTLSAEDLPALRDYRDECRRLLRGSSPETITMCVGKLSLHYPQPSMDENANATRWGDWFDDFAETPPDILEAACRDWRRSDARFAPSPGQLLAKCFGTRFRETLQRRASECIELLESGWRPGSGANGP
jgi:hypothetical protein